MSDTYREEFDAAAADAIAQDAQRSVTCLDCGRAFDPKDDEARCPASGGSAYHRSKDDR